MTDADQKHTETRPALSMVSDASSCSHPRPDAAAPTSCQDPGPDPCATRCAARGSRPGVTRSGDPGDPSRSVGACWARASSRRRRHRPDPERRPLLLRRRPRPTRPGARRRRSRLDRAARSRPAAARRHGRICAPSRAGPMSAWSGPTRTGRYPCRCAYASSRFLRTRGRWSSAGCSRWSAATSIPRRP